MLHFLIIGDHGGEKSKLEQPLSLSICFIRFITGANIDIFTITADVVLRNFCHRERVSLAALPDFFKERVQLFMQVCAIS